MKRKVRIATLYHPGHHQDFPTHHMGWIRWLRISEALARRGFEVDLIVNTTAGRVQKAPNLRFVPYSQFQWQEYDVIKTLFHRGYDALAVTGGDAHPFIISKLGSVVAGHDATDVGIHFVGAEREALYATQRRIATTSKYVTVLTESSKRLWEHEFGHDRPLLIVPTGVDAEIPPPKKNPYEAFSERIVVYVGYLYDEMQKQVNLRWQHRLNVLGSELRNRNIRLCVIGAGDVEMLDHSAVTYLGIVPNDDIWDYHYFADVGVVLAQGAVQHNESSKIYYYLRSGLPVVSEAPVPNNALLHESGLGLVVEHDQPRVMADAIEMAIHSRWPRREAVTYMLERHTWDNRARIYETILRHELGLH
jgi:glycosyltransferase involved in cell wall biosynthesis